ncbi:MAG: cysteine desulfurase NifS [bacterium]
MRTIYLDNNATTRVAEEVIQEMLPYLGELYGNPSSMHSFGGNVAKRIAEARDRVANLVGAGSASEIIFTSCGTESDNAALFGTLRSYPEKRHIVTTRVEHPAVLNTCRYLQKEGYRVTFLSVNQSGQLDLDELRESITPDTAIVSIMHANNETGVIFPLAEIAGIVKEKGAVFHTDAVQTVGKVPLNLKESSIDMLSLSGHKLHAPKGVGALYLRGGVRFTPFLMGGHQERGRRGGTENVASIIGLGKACELAFLHIDEERTRVRALRDRLENSILEQVPNARVNGDRIHRLPNTSNISFEFIEGEAILLLLSDRGIAASSGSACTSGSLEPSHVLRAMGVPFTHAHGSIRFSLSRYTTREEIDTVIRELLPIVERLRAISPFGPKKKPPLHCGQLENLSP